MSQDKDLISVVVPVYNERDSLEELNKKLQDAFEKSSYDLEIIFVDDGSKDGSKTIEKELADSYSNITQVDFLTNKGKAEALNAGFAAARGKYIATIDADLQDDPYAIPKMADQLVETDVDLVSGWKKDRKDPFVKKHTSKIFNYFTRLLSGIKLHDFNNGLKVYRREVVKNITLYGEMHRYVPVIAGQQGFTSGERKVRHFPRKYGETKYGINRFWRGFFDLITVTFITKYMKRPMHFFGISGIIFLFFGLISEFYVLILKYVYNEPFNKHFAMLLFGALLLIFGIQSFSIGLIGELITYFNKRKNDTRK
ncbi:MAG TPA: glycosyltransferase family 2 protein [bacterium]|nr:glycosyltransferase family 2 protein [bacterium]